MPAPAAFEGRVSRKKSNALVMTFADGSTGPDGKPVALATPDQGGGDGKGAKLGVLFGFKNGGPGKHRVTFSDGAVLFVESRDQAPTLITDAAGAAVASVERGDTSTVLGADGQALLRVLGRSDGTPDAYEAVIAAPDDRPLGTLNIVRTQAGWTTITRIIMDPVVLGIAGAPLKTPILGVRVAMDAPIDQRTSMILVAVSVDIAIGLRPYVAAQRR